MCYKFIQEDRNVTKVTLSLLLPSLLSILHIDILLVYIVILILIVKYYL